MIEGSTRPAGVLVSSSWGMGSWWGPGRAQRVCLLVGVVLERRGIACAESWPSFIWSGGLRTEVVRPAPGCDASLRSDAWDSHLDSKGQVLEVGTFLGKTTMQIAQAMALSEKLRSGFVVSLDMWLGDSHMWSDKRHRRCIECDHDYFDTLMTRQGMPMFYFQYLFNVMHSGVQRHVVPFPMATNGAARVLHFHDWHPDMVYIDASHHALDVLQDLEHFWFLLKCGGTMFGDDWHWDGVRSAVLAFACRRNLSIAVVELARKNTKWIVQAKSC
mmetsp:Transcript_175102/g.556136  ORF Transcript_175102/g.556136 Transcript_175102/m.556136 type:complete len:273 (-) Transcript_175102:345-1163(-)